MELRHIRYFLALAEELNFSRAAEKLHIAQPPLSKQIKELEEEIGANLFNRTKRHVELTNAGQVFLDKAYQILDQVEQACISTRLTSTGTEGELVIGFSGSVQDLIQTIQRYRERYPKVGIVLQQLSTPIQVKNLIEKKLI
ncbi:LysR family transcriptional regulator [Bacillus thuringiensis]|uniref:LysR family transcriptional regulator n=1 Tax=Bacillus cereus group TaxID=86661 RepID=UPI0005B6EB1B|nr:LysR family transcriptional regulator [Bacillus thuringiensis]MCU5282700.1 LysR family transcriptional regulator [Bacillus cereus]KIP26977.1 bacterial regulatory helix-turn-helix, lysR family protein [Bacillus thuringiensis serovar morrisoni]MEC3299083.1 LysR family transcriptional regulator [Bacillus thuringiensis]MEC3399231.1 LysR family transcriptional regulator [Bacillus thuringiensis]MED2067301.1 LysR family transcriptional regulator [Bacillus thuringiensis]